MDVIKGHGLAPSRHREQAAVIIAECRKRRDENRGRSIDGSLHRKIPVQFRLERLGKSSVPIHRSRFLAGNGFSVIPNSDTRYRGLPDRKLPDHNDPLDAHRGKLSHRRTYHRFTDSAPIVSTVVHIPSRGHDDRFRIQLFDLSRDGVVDGSAALSGFTRKGKDRRASRRCILRDGKVAELRSQVSQPGIKVRRKRVRPKGQFSALLRDRFRRIPC